MREPQRAQIFDHCGYKIGDPFGYSQHCTSDTKRNWKKAVFSVAFRKFPQPLQTRSAWFDTIMWGPWLGEAVSDSVGSPNALSSKFLMSRMSYITQARYHQIAMLRAGERISMWQIRQSGLGICYLYDAIALMAHWGFLEEPGLSESGVYKITIFDPREQRWRPLFLDDRQAAGIRYDNALLGASMTNTKVVSLLVKAYAKLYGNIEPTVGGTASGVLSYFLATEADPWVELERDYKGVLKSAKRAITPIPIRTGRQQGNH